MAQIFISYTQQFQHDSDTANTLRDWLNSNGFETWMDIHDLRAGERRDRAIHNAMKNADVVLGLMSPRSLQDEDTRAQWEYAVNNNKFQPLRLGTFDVSHRYTRFELLDFTGTDSTQWPWGRLLAILQNVDEAKESSPFNAPPQAPNRVSLSSTPNPVAEQFNQAVNNFFGSLRQNLNQPKTINPTPPPMQRPTQQASGQPIHVYKPTGRNDQMSLLVIGVLVGVGCTVIFLCSLLSNMAQ